MEWYHAAGLILGLISLVLVVSINWRNYTRDRREREYHKLTIKDTIYDAEAVMSSVSTLSRDYDYMEGSEASEQIAAYARLNTPKIERYIDEIRRHSLHLESRDPLKEHVKEVLAALDWFITTYGNDGGKPSIKQRVVWNKEREKINEKIDQVLAVAENL